MVAQSCVMRAIPRLLTAAGLDLCWSYLIADIGRALYDYYLFEAPQ